MVTEGEDGPHPADLRMIAAHPNRTRGWSCAQFVCFAVVLG